MKSCYIHIPFCQSICSYCDFCKLFYNEKIVDNYLNSLDKEIKNNYKGEPLKTIYIGGGTPSCLTTKELEKLFTILKQLNMKETIEFTIEGNFENTTKEKLEIYKKNGINRLSFGIETTSKEGLNKLDRVLNKKNVEKVIKEARKLEFNNINIDLIYAIPNETIKQLKEDIKYILSLDIEHISTYSLILEEHTKLKINHEKNINEEKDAKMYEIICKTLKEEGYNHYEISNFAKEGYSSKHNLQYWNNEKYYGFGLGASSYIKNQRIQNTRSITKYNKNIITSTKEILTKQDELEYEIILNLRKKEGISLSNFEKKYQKKLEDIYNISELIKQKLLIQKDNNLFIPEEKWYISNEIIVKLLGSEKYE